MKAEESMNLGIETEGEGAPASAAAGPGINFKAVAERIKREFRRHQLTDRDRLVADALCDISYGLGLGSVKIPKLETLGDLVGLPRQHIYTHLRRLHEMRIITVQPKEGVHLYTLNPNSDAWKVMTRVALTTVLRATETIRELNGVPEGEPAEISTPEDKRQIMLFSVTDSVTVTREVFPEIR